jgi:hypothetical protein
MRDSGKRRTGIHLRIGVLRLSLLRVGHDLLRRLVLYLESDLRPRARDDHLLL